MPLLKLGAFGLFLISGLFFTGCGERSSHNVNNGALEEEIQNREIKKVSEADITRAALQKGAFIADTAQKLLFSKLMQQLRQTDSLKDALAYCNTNAYSLTDSLSKVFKADIRRVSLKTRSKNNDPDELELALLDAYLYNIENGLPLEENVQEVDGDYILYTKPITIESPLCLTCHGEVGKDISPEHLQEIRKLYPGDKAVGYKMGDFRGMWSIKLSKKEIIKAL